MYPSASCGRVKAPTKGRESKVHRDEKLRVLSVRNQAVAAVGAWVESGEDFTGHPAALAVVTDQLQAERRRANTENLLRFQDEVRHRVAHQSKVTKKRQVPQADRVSPTQLWSALTPGLPPVQQKENECGLQESKTDARQIRLRLAACRVIPCDEETSDLPGGRWNVSPSRHCPDGGDSALLDRQHQCPLVQQKGRGHVSCQPEETETRGFKTNHSFSGVLWPLNEKEELQRQRQTQFLLHRRLAMNSEREQVKENRQQRKHQRRTARIKAEKEQLRLQEERRLEEARQLQVVQRKLDERELLIMERLRLEEEEDRAVEQQRKKREEKGKEADRFVSALRAQMKQRLSQSNCELPPLCCCASSFWDSHPKTCANNCIFHNNPKAYAQALHSTMVSLELQ